MNELDDAKNAIKQWKTNHDEQVQRKRELHFLYKEARREIERLSYVEKEAELAHQRIQTLETEVERLKEQLEKESCEVDAALAAANISISAAFNRHLILEAKLEANRRDIEELTEISKTVAGYSKRLEHRNAALEAKLGRARERIIIAQSDASVKPENIKDAANLRAGIVENLSSALNALQDDRAE